VQSNFHRGIRHNHRGIDVGDYRRGNRTVQHDVPPNAQAIFLAAVGGAVSPAAIYLIFLIGGGEMNGFEAAGAALLTISFAMIILNSMWSGVWYLWRGFVHWRGRISWPGLYFWYSEFYSLPSERLKDLEARSYE
jgi:hypothetical protein